MALFNAHRYLENLKDGSAGWNEERVSALERHLQTAGLLRDEVDSEEFTRAVRSFIESPADPAREPRTS